MELDAVASQMTLATDLALGVLRRMSTHDTNTVNEVLGFFRKSSCKRYPAQNCYLGGSR